MKKLLFNITMILALFLFSITALANKNNPNYCKIHGVVCEVGDEVEICYEDTSVIVTVVASHGSWIQLETDGIEFAIGQEIVVNSKRYELSINGLGNSHGKGQNEYWANELIEETDSPSESEPIPEPEINPDTEPEINPDTEPESELETAEESEDVPNNKNDLNDNKGNQEEIETSTEKIDILPETEAEVVYVSKSLEKNV